MFACFPKATAIMVGQMVGLTALEIKNAQAGMHADGNGLYLCVKPGGTKSWVFRFQIDGRRREMGLGALSTLEPVKARAEAARLKAKIAGGIDPLDERRADKEMQSVLRKQALLETKRAEMTFRKAAEHFIESRKPGWSNTKHVQQWTNTLATYAYPVIGDLPVSEVAAEHVVEILRPIWSTKSETASRVRMRIEAVLNAAKLMGWRTGENPAIFKGGLEAVLPPIRKVRRVRHHPAMPFSEVPSFFAKLRERRGVSPLALEFCILTAARSGEVRNATWDEVDLESCQWIVPAERMKARRAQICEHADYFGNGDVGPVIAREIRARSRRTKGYEVDLLWEEACRMYERLPFDPDWKDASKDAQRQYIGDQMGIPKNRAIVALLGSDIENLEQWSERFRKQLAKRRPTK